jgi:hypothetical protein
LYGPILLVHSYLRWLVLVGLITVGVRSWLGWRKGRDWDEQDERLHFSLIGAVDVQLAVGPWLYIILSPLPHVFWADPEQGLRQPVVRFFGVEHITGMVLAILILHFGRAWSSRAMTDQPQRHWRVWTTTLAAFLIVVISIPWPGLVYARPLFRLPSF